MMILFFPTINILRNLELQISLILITFLFSSLFHDIFWIIMWNVDVILRPGPYIDAERDFGGLPYWLLKDTNIQLRYLKTFNSN